MRRLVKEPNTVIMGIGFALCGVVLFILTVAFLRDNGSFTSLLWVLAGAFLAQLRPHAIEMLRRRGTVNRAPAGWMGNIAEFLFSKKTYEGVFEPLAAEQAFEWMEAVVDNQVWKLRWLRIKHPFHVTLHILAQGPLSAAKTIVGLWKLL